MKNTRAKHAHLRKELQSKGTRSAKRTLKNFSGRERRFATDVNHCISKQIANSEHTVFALEDLSKIRVQKRRGKQFCRKLNSWSFYQLEQFIRYKAETLGKHVLLVDDRYTSQKCSEWDISTKEIVKDISSVAANVGLNSMLISMLLVILLRRVYLAWVGCPLSTS